MAATRPKVVVDRLSRLRHGFPWVYSNEIEMNAVTRELTPGSIVSLVNQNGSELATAFFNPKSLISARILSTNPSEDINVSWFKSKITRALSLRQRLFDNNFYRLLYAEADGIPGLVMDRHGDTIVAQINSAGMNLLQEPLKQAIDEVLQPRQLVFRLDSPARIQESLVLEETRVFGERTETVVIEDGGARFPIDPINGQKTGWFYDHRQNRQTIAKLARGQRILDLYSFSGGFAINAALHGATAVAVDSSESAIARGIQAASLNGVSDRCTFLQQDVSSALVNFIQQSKLFDVVVLDPPSFVSSRKNLAVGLRAYRKLASSAAKIVSPNGWLFIASCSHNVSAEALLESVRAGLHQSGRESCLVQSTGADMDHPIHPFLAESVYLKSLLFHLD